MAKATDIRLVSVRAEIEHFDYRMPIKFGGRVLNDVLMFHVTVEVESRDGRRGQGFGSMPMGNIWAWPTSRATPDQTLAAMTALAHRMVERAGQYQEFGHPLEITHELNQQYLQLEAEAVCKQLATPEPMPRLAQLVAASPLEAAIHDAYGKALGANSYNLLGPEFVNRDLGFYLDQQFAGEYLDRYTLREPKPKMPLYHLIGALDPLSPADVQTAPDDGLPVTLDQWILYDGLTHLKIKLNGDDLAWDVDRVVSVERVAAEAQRQRGCTQWFYSADFNERCQSVEYVLEWLAKVGERAPEALERLQYIEQPTHRDLAAYPENKMHRAAAIKPVVIDESLVDYQSLLLARELGYSGVALKTCKGHSEALMMGAAAQKFGMFLCVQDLTCPGYSFLHSASLAARVPTVAAIEGNARQYCPAANAGWANRYPEFFHPTDGSVPTGVLTGPGLGI
ncbi:MAG: mandelate racemase/muconate lactonizing enzyme family protein [Thermoguttaceae bacterium]|nr:mandelate racemase/muconate lactonizing enzyme family protein [Thermoguttaceae bacterium]MDW8037660.1 mandelate racemase/muconate lactonizing enzyme family protein [Thermoguttaceae bacterium]